MEEDEDVESVDLEDYVEEEEHEAPAEPEADREEPVNETESAPEDKDKTPGDDFDIGDLSEKIMSSTSKQTAEQERFKELESMGPAPVLPELIPENMRPGKTIDEENEEDMHIYRPLTF